MISRIALSLMIGCTLITSLAQLLFKKGVADLIFPYWYLMSGLVLYGLGALLLIMALRYGDLSLTYPIISTSFIWVAILAAIFLGEKITVFRSLGIGLIIIGISILHRYGDST